MKGHYTFPSAQCTHHYHQNCYETILNSLNISIICLPKLLLNALATFLLVFFFFYKHSFLCNEVQARTTNLGYSTILHCSALVTFYM